MRGKSGARFFVYCAVAAAVGAVWAQAARAVVPESGAASKPVPALTTVQPIAEKAPAKGQPLEQKDAATSMKAIAPKSSCRTISATVLPAAEANSFDLPLQKVCPADGSPCRLAVSPNIRIPNGTLSSLRNVNPEVYLWFPFPGSTERDAPSRDRGIMVAPGDRFDQEMIGIPENMPLTLTATVYGVPYCLQDGVFTYCEHDNAFLRLYFAQPR